MYGVVRLVVENAPVDGDAPSGDEGHDTDSDFAAVWEEIDVDRQRAAPRHAQADAQQLMPDEKSRGYIELGGETIGRIVFGEDGCQIHHRAALKLVGGKSEAATRVLEAARARGLEFIA